MYGTREKVDITDISYSISGSDITVSLTVKDGIDTSNQNIIYWVYLQAVGLTELDYYFLSYSQGQGIISSAGNFAGYLDLNPDFNISSDGKTLSYTFTGVDPTNSFEPWGFAIEYLDFGGGEGGEAWVDYAPAIYAPWYDSGEEEEEEEEQENNEENAGENGEDNGSPGFELLVFVAAIVVALLFIRRKK